MTKKRCRHCRRLFIVSPRNPDQKFCSSHDCQKSNSDFEKCKANSGYLISRQLSRLEFLNQWLNILSNISVSFGQGPNIALEFKGEPNIDFIVRHQCLSTALR